MLTISKVITFFKNIEENIYTMAKGLGQKVHGAIRTVGRKAENVVSKVDKGVSLVEKKIGQAENFAQNKINQAEKTAGNVIDKTNVGLQRAVDKSGKALEVGRKVAGGVETGLRMARESGITNIPVVAQAAGLTEKALGGVKRGLSEAEKLQEKAKSVRIEKGSVRKAAEAARSGVAQSRQFV